MVKVSKQSSPPAVRTRRAYFDCQFGQLHVRTAFPTTGGFDELATLACLHPSDASSRSFNRILPLLADVRSVYAPDLPGYGESDSSPARSVADAATAIGDLAGGLRLRQIDLLGVGYGAAVAVELAVAKPELVRRLVLIDLAAADRLQQVMQPHQTVDASRYGDHPFDAAPRELAEQIDAFLRRRP